MQSLFHNLISQGGNTTPDDEQLFGVVGDSNADGAGESIPVVAGSTLYLWDGSAFNQITTQSVANNGTGGSIWQQFATNYKAATNFKTLLVNGALGGAEFYPNGDNNNWYTSGTLYAAWKTEMTQALANKGLSAPKAIFVNLGVNDYRSANTITDIRTGIDSFFSRITADYPGVPILCIQMGRSEAGGFGGDARAYDIRSYLVAKAEEYTNVHIVGSGAFFNGVTGGYLVDNLHYSQATNNAIGAQFSLWFVNSTITNKWARSVVVSHYDQLTTNRKTLVADFITDMYDNGNYFKLEYLSNFCTASINNLYMDWTFLGYGAPGSTMGYTANSHMTTTGAVSSFLAINYTPSFYNRASSVNDVILGVKLRTRVTASGVTAVMIGRGDGTNFIRIAQSTTFVNYHVNVSAADQRNTAETSLTAGTLYSCARNGGTEYLIKNKTIDDTHSLTSDGAVTQNVVIGVSNNNGTIAAPLSATYEYSFAAKYSNFDLDSFYDGIEYIIAHWND